MPFLLFPFVLLIDQNVACLAYISMILFRVWCTECGKQTMGSCCIPFNVLLYLFVWFCAFCQCFAADVDTNQTALLTVNASALGQKIPDTLFGIFFEVVLLL